MSYVKPGTDMEFTKSILHTLYSWGYEQEGKGMPKQMSAIQKIKNGELEKLPNIFTVMYLLGQGMVEIAETLERVEKEPRTVINRYGRSRDE